MARNQKSSPLGVVVIGLGRFGKSLALELESDGVEVLGIDADLQVVQALSGRLTHVVQANATDVEALRQLGVQDFDRVVIAVATDLEASVLTAFVVRSLGVPNIWAKAVTESHASILEQIGVEHVVRPEHDMGRRVAHLVRGSMMDYIEFDDGYAIVKTRPPESIVGMSLDESGVRTKYGVTIVGIKSPGSDFTYATPETVVHPGDLVIVSGDRRRVEHFSNQD